MCVGLHAFTQDDNRMANIILPQIRYVCVLIPSPQILYYLRLAWPKERIIKKKQVCVISLCSELKVCDFIVFRSHHPKYYTTSD